MIGEQLTGDDYFNLPLIVLSSHPNFSRKALAKVNAVASMTTEQLESLNLEDDNG